MPALNFLKRTIKKPSRFMTKECRRSEFKCTFDHNELCNQSDDFF